MPGLGVRVQIPPSTPVNSREGFGPLFFAFDKVFVLQGESFVCGCIFECDHGEQGWPCKAGMLQVDCCASVVFGVCVQEGMPTFLVRGLSGSQGAFR